MNAVQRAALDNSMSPSFTEEEAKHVLNWYVGSSPVSRLLGTNPPVGVVSAVKKLGGTYHPQVGIYNVPNYNPVDEL